MAVLTKKKNCRFQKRDNPCLTLLKYVLKITLAFPISYIKAIDSMVDISIPGSPINLTNEILTTRLTKEAIKGTNRESHHSPHAS